MTDKSWIRWAVLGAVAAGVALLFLWGPGESESGARPTGPGAKPTPVRTAAIQRGTFVERATYPGELDADAADVAANASGRLVSVSVRIGDVVTRGTELAQVDTSELSRQRVEASARSEAAAASKRRAEIELETARRELDRAKELVAQGLISEQELDNQRSSFEAAQASVAVAAANQSQSVASAAVLGQRLHDSRLRAPFDGVVARRYHDPGNFVTVGTPVVRIVARAPLRVRFEVPEDDIGRFPAEARFEVRAANSTGEPVVGRVTGSSAEVDRARRIVHLEGVIDEPPAAWLPGMYADVVTESRTIEDATLVPATALVSRLQSGGKVENGIFQAIDGVARWVPVEIVARDEERAAISGDLAAGVPVLVAGHNDLADGAPIRLAEQRDGGES